MTPDDAHDVVAVDRGLDDDVQPAAIDGARARFLGGRARSLRIARVAHDLLDAILRAHERFAARRHVGGLDRTILGALEPPREATFEPDQLARVDLPLI